jgi:hypothetical protein
MSISGISSSSSLYDLYRSYSKLINSSSGGQSGSFGSSSTVESGTSSSNTIAADLNLLLKALEAGNISTVQSSFSQLLKDVQAVSPTDDINASTSSTSGTGNEYNPLARDMSDLGDAISSGDLTGAQSILANIMQHMQGPPPPPPANESTDSNSLSSALSELGNALSSGDTSTAQTILEQIIANLQTTGTSSSDDESDSTSSTSGTGTNSNPLANDLSKLEDALSADDLSSAQSIFANIMRHMQGPPPPDVSASANAASASSSSTLSSDFSTLLEALVSGDLTGAQSSFSKLLEDLQSNSSTDSSSTSTASTSDTSTTTSSDFSLQLEKLLATWTNLMATSTQMGTTNILA